jgi:hypothetical protein
MDNNNKELFGMIENIVNHTKQIKDDSVIYKADVVSDIQKLNTKIDNLNTTIVEQNLLVSSFKKSIDKYKIFIWAACGLIAILGTLSQFGIVSITWFKK